MSCERHCLPRNLVNDIKKAPHYQPGRYCDEAVKVIKNQEKDIKLTENQKRLKETEKLAKNIINQLPPEIHYPVCVSDDNSPTGEKEYEICIVDKNNEKVAYTSPFNKKPKWVNYTSFCVFTHIFIKDENGYNVPNPEKMSQFFPDLPKIRQTA